MHESLIQIGTTKSLANRNYDEETVLAAVSAYGVDYVNVTNDNFHGGTFEFLRHMPHLGCIVNQEEGSFIITESAINAVFAPIVAEIKNAAKMPPQMAYKHLANTVFCTWNDSILLSDYCEAVTLRKLMADANVGDIYFVGRVIDAHF